jgi:hypothetical protein
MAVEYAELIGAVCGVGSLILSVLAAMGITCCLKWRLNVQIEYIPPLDDGKSLTVRLVSSGSSARLRAVTVKGLAWPAAGSDGTLWPVERMARWAAEWQVKAVTCKWYSPTVGAAIRTSDPLLHCERADRVTRRDWLTFKVEAEAILADVLGKLEIWYDPQPGGGWWQCLTCGNRKLSKRCVLYSFHDFTSYA